MKKIEKEEFFKVILEKTNGELEEKIYRKINEKFNGDYAVVKAYSKDNKYANHTWMGVINKNFETIVPFRLWNIELIGNNILAQESKRITHHMKINKDRVEYIKTIGKYEKVTDDIIVTKDQENYFYLYKLSIGKRISSLFTEIGEFVEVEGDLIAYAKKRFPIEDIYRIPMEMKCYIDINGDPWSDTYIPFNNRYRYFTKEEFDFCFQKLLESIRYEQSIEKRDSMQVALKLRKKTRPISTNDQNK